MSTHSHIQLLQLRGGATKTTTKGGSKGEKAGKNKRKKPEVIDDEESDAERELSESGRDNKGIDVMKSRTRENQAKYTPETLPDKLWKLFHNALDMFWPGLFDTFMGKKAKSNKGGKITRRRRASKAGMDGGSVGESGQKESTTSKPASNSNNPSSFTSMSNSGSSNARIQRELKDFLQAPPKGTKLIVGSNIRSWTVEITGAQGTIYAGETYKLRINFPKDYPSKPPSVYFLKPTPRHRHVYSNGDICLNLLGRDWRPTLTAEGLAVSILSMLSSAKEKSIPQDNAMHADSPPGQQQQGWMYHDDKC